MNNSSGNIEQDQSKISESTLAEENTCIQCKSQIPVGANLCVHCGSYQNKVKNHFKYAAFIVGFIAALGTAAMHSVSLFPIVRTILFPNSKIEVIGFKSNQRLIFANTGNQELFVSHIHYEAKGIPYRNMVKEKLSIVLDKPKESVTIAGDLSTDPFDTNEDVGIVIKPGEVVKHIFDKDIPEGMSYVHGRTQDDWLQIVLIASANKKSSCIRPVFYSINDRRFKQMKDNTGFGINTFPAKAFISTFSPRTGKIIEFPFEVIGTVAINQDKKCTEKIERWISPRRGHIEDLK